MNQSRRAPWWRTGARWAGAGCLAVAMTALPTTPSAGAATLAAPTPATPAHDPTSGSQTITLITGDRVRLTRWRTGPTTARLLPGSPHLDLPLQTITAGDDLYVRPRLPDAHRRRMDISAFNVSAIARNPERVPLTVEFAPGERVRPLPGLMLDRASVRRQGGGRIVEATYDATAGSPVALGQRLAGIARITGPRPMQPDFGDYQLRKLTVSLTADDVPVGVGTIALVNLEDSRIYTRIADVYQGEMTLQVPEGEYGLIADDDRGLITRRFSVLQDTTIAADTAAATVRPSATLDGYRRVDQRLSIVYRSHKSGFVSFGFSGYAPRLEPNPDNELLSTTYGETLVPGGQQAQAEPDPAPIRLTRLAATKEILPGIPASMDYEYTRSDFATVTLQNRTRGQGTTIGLNGVFGLTAQTELALITTYPVRRPGKVTALLQGSDTVGWMVFGGASSTSDAGGGLFGIDEYRAGQKAVVPLYRAPLTSVGDRGNNEEDSSIYCVLCVHRAKLQATLAMQSSAGTGQLGVSHAREGRYALFANGKMIKQGKRVIELDSVSVAPGSRLRLATRLATRISDKVGPARARASYRFTMPGTDGTVPLLRADYVPPTTMRSVGRPGRVTFPLRLDNLGPDANRITDATFEISTDQRTWRQASLTRTADNAFTVSYRNPPATKRRTAMSLHVRATDEAGNRIDETVKKAYLLPTGSTRGTRATSAAPSAEEAIEAVSLRPDERVGSSGIGSRFDPERLCRSDGSRTYSCFTELGGRIAGEGARFPRSQGLGATDLRRAYDVPKGGARPTVAVLIAGHYPHAEKDLNVYRKAFGLKPCTSQSGCFRQINQEGKEGDYPPVDQNWAVEAALDLQMISASCPTCRLILAEANAPYDRSLAKATRAAVRKGATVTNHSYGRQETRDIVDSAAVYDQVGVTAVTATGDWGYDLASFPASVPGTVSVGGTRLTEDPGSERGWSERAWAAAGSGCSGYFDKPAWQTDTTCLARTYGDLSAASKDLGIYITSVPPKYRGWLKVSGTSASSPFVAGLIGHAGEAGMKPDRLYSRPDAFNDITNGRNGLCQGNYICTAVPGYDGPTGWGTPRGLAPFQP